MKADSSTTRRPAPAPWGVALASVGGVVALALGVVAAAGVAMDSAVAPNPPPGARDSSGSVETLPDAAGAPDRSPAAASASGRVSATTEAPEAPETPGDEPSPSASAAATPEVDPAWLDRVSDRTGIPRRALRGYASAQVLLAEGDADCQVSWPTLAGIGWVESRHGTYGGGEIGPDGTTTVDIIGVPLDGGPGLARLPETGEGELDGDSDWQRAVGPMQFIPTTWSQWGSDADGNGEADPHDIDDAAYSAARYLCADDRILTDRDDWWQALLSYNRSREYVEEVLDAAVDYADTANA